MITRVLLHSLRNDLPMAFTIRQLGEQTLYFKAVEGRLRFQCPHCRETLAVINPRNNLAHCFGCTKNINNIDLLIASGYTFRQAVESLQTWLRLYNAEQVGQKKKTLCLPSAPVETRNNEPELLGTILRREFGNRR